MKRVSVLAAALVAAGTAPAGAVDLEVTVTIEGGKVSITTGIKETGAGGRQKP